MYGTKMQAFRPATAGMPCGIALAWAVVDLHLAFWFRLSRLALEVPLDWCNANPDERGEETTDVMKPGDRR